MYKVTIWVFDAITKGGGYRACSLTFALECEIIHCDWSYAPRALTLYV